MASSAASAFAELSLEEMEAVVAEKIKKAQVELDAKLAVVAREKADAAHSKAMTDLEAKMLSKGIKERSAQGLAAAAGRSATTW